MVAKQIRIKYICIKKIQLYLIDADVFKYDLFATCQVKKYNRFSPYLDKNFDFKVKGNTYYIVHITG